MAGWMMEQAMPLIIGLAKHTPKRPAYHGPCAPTLPRTPSHPSSPLDCNSRPFQYTSSIYLLPLWFPSERSPCNSAPHNPATIKALQKPLHTIMPATFTLTSSQSFPDECSAYIGNRITFLPKRNLRIWIGTYCQNIPSDDHKFI